MAEASKIQWCDATFNPWRGCTKVSEGCRGCYAEAQSKRNPLTLGVWGPGGTRVVASESMWREPLKWERLAREGKLPDGTPNPDGHRPRVFCASLADVFEQWDGPMADAAGNRLHRGDGLVGGAVRSSHWYSESPCDDSGAPLLTADDVRARLLCLIHQTPGLDWLLLTKRPEHVRATLTRMAERGDDGGDLAKQWLYDSPMPNVWIGTSVENQAAADARVPHLLRVPAAVRFLSCEPLLGPVRLKDVPGLNKLPGVHVMEGRGPAGIDWVIVGGESGPGARPFDLAWARSLRDQCEAAGVPYFLKQLGERPYIEGSAGRSALPDALGWTVAPTDPADPGTARTWLHPRDKKGGDPAEWPEDLRVRQFPGEGP